MDPFWIVGLLLVGFVFGVIACKWSDRPSREDRNIRKRTWL